MDRDRFPIARIGRTVGLRGDLKLHLLTDFPDQFQPGRTFESDRGFLEIAAYNPARALVRFVGYDTPEQARTLTHTQLYTTTQATRETITLAAGEYFWFDLIGCRVVESETTLGVVEAIDRMPGGDYLSIRTDAALVDMGCSAAFLVPYVPRYVRSVDLEARQIETVDARDLLEAS